MKTMFISGMVGFGLAIVVFLTFWIFRLKNKGPRQVVNVYASIEELRSVGELVVFKIVTKEIVTTAEHWFGEFGKRYFKWLVSTKKMAMVFEFDIDFKYDLRSPDFVIQKEKENKYRLEMPKCFYETHIRDISIYDEQAAKLLPWLLPELITRAFGVGFDENAKNRLKEEAKHQAAKMAKDFVNKMRPEVQTSAQQTLETLAKGFGVEHVTVDFKHADLVQLKVDSSTSENINHAEKEKSGELT